MPQNNKRSSRAFQPGLIFFISSQIILLPSFGNSDDSQDTNHNQVNAYDPGQQAGHPDNQDTRYD
jgi:hypothetical protein